MIYNKTKGIVYIILSAFFFSFMNLFVRLAGNLPALEKSFFRNAVALVFAAAILLKKRQPFRWTSRSNLRVLVIRSLFGTLGIIFNFYSVDHLVFSDASMLNKLSPFFVLVFSFFFLGEKLRFSQALPVVLAFAGSLFIIKPSFDNAALFASVVGFLGGLTAGAAYTAVRYLGQHGENGSFIVFFFSAFSCLVTLPFVTVFYQPMTLVQLAMLLCAGLAAAGGQFCITAAYRNAPAREISVYDYTQIVFAAGLGFAVFGQMPDSLSVMGYLVIVGMGVLVFFGDKKHRDG
ncbi:MAG: DMT family transporter [Oscillospiraceae bacterium]